jgi:hypothetical protein
MKKLVYAAMLAVIIGVAGCKQQDSGNHLINKAQENVDAQSARVVGFPNIVNFQEKREYKLIYELRDRTFTTITYLKGRGGHLHKMCDSIGYGIPYSTQYSNPERARWEGGNTNYSLKVLPQADPNGLYSAPESAATWILCYDPSTKQVEPVYSESNIIVSQFPLTDDTSKDSTIGAPIHLTAAQIASAIQQMVKPRKN